jgi:hypothetical protein
MQRGSVFDFGLLSIVCCWSRTSFAKSKLEHREERVRNRYKKSYICIAFALASTLSLMAQSDRMEVQGDNLQSNANYAGQPLLTAKVAEAPVVPSASRESDLPDAPSTTKPDTSTADPTPAPPPVAKREHGAAPAAMGGPLAPDRSVADRNYLLLTAGMFGASVLNAEMTLHCLKQHVDCNDVPPSLHSRTALYGIGIPADLGVAYLTYFMKKKHSSIWYVPAAIVTGGNLFLAMRAYRWSQDPPKTVGIVP